MNKMPSEMIAVGGVIDPDATAAGTVTSDWLDMADFEACMAVAFAGTLGASATFDAKLEQATDSGGSGAKDVSGSDITQLTQAGTDQSDEQAVIQCRAEDLDLANDFRFVRLSITVGTATSDAGGVIFGVGPRYGPASDSDHADVSEIVTV